MSISPEELIRRTLMRDGFSLEEANRAIAETHGFPLEERPARRFPWRRWVLVVVVALVVIAAALVTVLIVVQ